MVVGMKNITYLEKPIIVNIYDWIIKNSGFVGVGKKTNNNTEVSLIAFQKSSVASKTIKKIAADNNAVIMVGLSEGDANAID